MRDTFSDMNEPHEVPADVQEFAAKLFDFARDGDLQLIQYIEHGIDPNMSNQDGNTFLMLAAYSGHAELTKALIEKGADVNKLNGRNQSPLAGVIFKKEDQLVDILLKAGADPYAGHPNAIDSARMFGRDDLADTLEK